MHDEERIARSLHSRLRSELRADVMLAGGGVHWHVEAVSAARRCRVDCFWHAPAPAVRELGMNPRNSREILGPSPRPRVGSHYLLALYDGEERVAGGRVHDEQDAGAVAAAWLAGRTTDELGALWPSVDATRRRMHALLAQIEARSGDVARCVIERTPLHALWIYGDGRSCHVHTDDEPIGCSFRLGPAQVAYASVVQDPASAVDLWIRGASLAQLTDLGATLEPHAELLERGDFARWHWAHTRDRVTYADDALADSRRLVERLAQSDVATRFFCHSSLSFLCFSASSHYPWASQGLPTITPPHPTPDLYKVSIGTKRTVCTLDDAVALVEATLAAYPVQPFFGSAADLAIAPLNAELATQGSALRASIVQRTQWFDVAVGHENRRCTIGESLRSVTLYEPGTEVLTARYRKPSQTVAALRRWLDDRCSLDEVRRASQPTRG